MKWIVQVKQDLTACDTVFRRGPTQRLISQESFDTEGQAMSYYLGQKNIFRFAGLAGQYVTYPQQREPEEVFEHHCDECGQGIPKEDDAYIGIRGADFCSKSCLNTDRSEPEVFDDQFEEDY